MPKFIKKRKLGSETFKIGKFALNCVVNTVLRTGAAHPLPNFSGRGRTRRTLSNEAPAGTEYYSSLLKSSHLW